MEQGAQNTNALLLEFANIFVGDDEASAVDLGAVENVNFTGEKAGFIKESDNRGQIVDFKGLTGIINFRWLEPGDLSRIETLFKGIVSLTNTAGTPVAGATQLVASGFENRTNIRIENQNGDGSQPTIDSVVGSVDGALTENVDFVIAKNGYGDWGIVPNTAGANLTTTAQTLTITYDYTPNASRSISGGETKIATPRFIKLVGPKAGDETKRRIVKIASSTADSDLVLPFLEPEKAGDVGGFDITMRGAKKKTWEIIDEINPS